MDEYSRQGFRSTFVSPIVYFESQVVYGEDFRTKPSREDFIPLFQSVISDAIMSIRHYITSQESVNSLVDGRLKRWALKPLCVALRAERYIVTGKYPRNFSELLAQSSGLPQEKAVEWILDHHNFTSDITRSPIDVLMTLLDIATGVSERVANLFAPY